MTRIRRLKIEGEDAFYHIISRTVGQQFLLKDIEKEKLLKIFKQYSALYFVKVLGYSIMSNHFHLLIRMETDESYSDEEIHNRLKNFYGVEYLENRFVNLSPIRERLSNLSEYVKGIKQSFAWWFNKRYHRRGYFWSERFKSVLIQRGESLLNCLGYIDLNPIRAGIVERPEEYRWSSLGYRVQHCNRDGFLSFSGLFDLENHGEIDPGKIGKNKETEREILRRYRSFVYDIGELEKPGQRHIDENILKSEVNRNYQLPKSELFLYRCRYFSDSLVLGSKIFIRDAYTRFSGKVFHKKERKQHPIGKSTGMFSIRRLNSIST